MKKKKKQVQWNLDSHRYFEGDKNFQRIKTDVKWLPVNIQCIKLVLLLSK